MQPMKVKTVKTTILEGVEFKLPPKRLLTPKDKVDIMEQFLMMPMGRIVELQQDGKQPAFVQQLARLLYNNNLGEYFDVLKMCREMAEKNVREKAAKEETL